MSEQTVTFGGFTLRFWDTGILPENEVIAIQGGKIVARIVVDNLRHHPTTQELTVSRATASDVVSSV